MGEIERHHSCVDALRANITALMAGRNETEVGKESGVGQDWLNRIMKPGSKTAIRAPGLPKLEKLARYFGIPLWRLLYDGPEFPGNFSQSVRLDVEKMATAMGTVDAIIARSGLEVSPLTKAAVLIKTYEAIDDAPMTPKKAVDMAAMALELLRGSE